MKAHMQINSSKSYAAISSVDYLERIAKVKRMLAGYNAKSLYEYEFEKIKDDQVSHFYSFYGGKSNDVKLLNRMEYICENLNQIPKQLKTRAGKPEEKKCDHCGKVIEPGKEGHYKGLVICEVCLDEALNIN